MEIRELRSLVLLEELGNITKIAERQHLSPAAVHKQLKVLESELSVTLYEKEGRRLRTTQAADVLLPHLKNLLAQYEAALSDLNEWKGLKRGVVRIGTGSTMSSHMLPSLLQEFRRRFPQLEAYVETGQITHLVHSLAAGTLDVIILVSTPLNEDPNLTVECTWEFELVLVGSSRHQPRRCRLDELTATPFILYKEGGLFERIIDQYFVEAGFRPNVIMRLDNADAIREMVRLDQGISVLPMWIVDRDLRGRRLHLIRQTERPLVARIAMVTRKDSYATKPAAAFLDLARRWDWQGLRLRTR